MAEGTLAESFRERSTINAAKDKETGDEMAETPLQKATREVKNKFNESLGATSMNQAAWDYYDQVFLVTIDNAIATFGALIWQNPNRAYVLNQVRLIARIARHFAQKRNHPQITRKDLSDAADIGIGQARFECGAGVPGQSCQGYQGPM